MRDVRAKYANQVDHKLAIHLGGPHWPGAAGLQCALYGLSPDQKSDGENPDRRT